MKLMRRLIASVLLLFAAATTAYAQLPQTLPANSVVGRLGIGSGPGQAIPFANFFPMVNAGLLAGNNTWTGTNTWTSTSTFNGATAFTVGPTVPTAPPASGSTLAASTAYVDAAVAAVTSFPNGIIDVFVPAGQSNAQGTDGDANLSPIVPSDRVLQYNGTSIIAGNDPVGVVGRAAVPASAWPAFGIAYNAATGRKVLFVGSALGGTPQCRAAGTNLTNDWDIGGTLAPAVVNHVNAAMTAARAAGYAPVLRGILWSQGEDDAGAIGTNTTFPTTGSTTVTGGPYTAGTTVITVASATGVSINEMAVITLDNGTTYSSNITNVAGTTVTLQVGVPVGRSIPNGAEFHIYSQADYRLCLQNMINYFRTTIIDGTTYPQLPFYISQTGGPSAGDNLGYQKVRQAQDQVALSDPYTRVVFRGAVGFITRNLMQTSSLHYKQEAYNEMGRQMALGVVSAQAGDQSAQQSEQVARVTFGGTLRNGDQAQIVITDPGVTGSPWTLGPVTVTLPGDTFASVAARFARNGNYFSPNLGAAGIYLTSAAITGGSVVTVHFPSTRTNPVPLVTANWITGGATETASVSTGGTAYGGSAENDLAWTSYTPTLACGAGTFTSAAATGKFRVKGKIAYTQASIAITTNGTCATFFTFTLPYLGYSLGYPASDTSCSGQDSSANKALSVGRPAGNSAMIVALYDGTYPGVNAHNYYINCTYEIN